MTGPLEGLRVVEIAGDITGPYCAKLLVDLGAEVTKIEPPSGDPLRGWGPFPAGGCDPARSGLFEYLNAGKRGATLDLTRTADVAAARKLIAASDMLLVALAPGILEQYGLDRETLHRLNPRLAVIRISNFGQSGPLRDRAMTPLTMQAASGWISINNPDHPPVGAGGRILEHIVGAYGALGALTALRIARQATGQVVEVDLSVFEAHLATLPYPMLTVQRTRTGPPAGPTAGPILGVVRVSDGWIGVNCLTGQHWLDVCAMLGLSEYGEHQLEIMRGGPRRAEFFTKAQPWLDQQTVAGLVELSQAFRIPAAPVSDGATAPECPQYAQRGFFVDTEGDGWSFRRPGAPFRFSNTPVSAPRAAPSLGVDNHCAPTIVGARDAGALNPTVDAAAPFAGLKVLDFSTFWAGAYVTCYLGAFGADVIKVESIQRPDGHRFSGAFPDDGDDWYEGSALWQATNLNKRDLTLDLSSERGRELVRRLASEADVVIENFSPRVVEQFGLAYESLVELKPDVIQLRMPGFGLEGPWRDYVGWALNIEQTSGMSAVTGYPDGPPCNLGGAADPNAGLHGAVALLAALEHRRRTGEGQLIEVAQIEAGACVAAEPVIEYSLRGTVQQRRGNRQRSYAQGVYPTSDHRWIALTVRDDTDWSQLVAGMGRPELLDDPRFSSARQREREHDSFDLVVSDWTRTRATVAIVETLRARNVPAELLLRPTEMYDIPQLDARAYYEEFDHPVTGLRRYPGWPFRITPGPKRHHRSAPPTLGEHNDEILRALGVSDTELAGLRDQRVIGERALNA